MSYSLISENFTEYWLFGQQTISEVIVNYTVAFNEIFLQILNNFETIFTQVIRYLF